MDYFIWEFMFKTSHSSGKIVCLYVRIEWESTCLTRSSPAMTDEYDLFFWIYLIHLYWNEMKWYISCWWYVYFVIFSCWPNIDEFDFFRMLKQQCKFFWSDSKHILFTKSFLNLIDEFMYSWIFDWIRDMLSILFWIKYSFFTHLYKKLRELWLSDSTVFLEISHGFWSFSELTEDEKALWVWEEFEYVCNFSCLDFYIIHCVAFILQTYYEIVI